MTTTDQSSASAPTLIGRPAASAVIAQCLLEQANEPARTRVQRIFGVNPLSAGARSWYAGALGELRVAQRLDTLGPEWTVLHAVPIGRGETDVDHLVIGRSGVFVINTKHPADAVVRVYSKRILVNGQKTDHLRNSEHERAAVTTRLQAALGVKVPVRSAIVVGARELDIKSQPEAVEVMTDRRVLRWLRARRRTSIDVAAVTAVAALPATWHDRGADAVVSADLPAFAALRAEVDRARAIRLAWVVGIGLAFAGTVLVITWPTVGALFAW